MHRLRLLVDRELDDGRLVVINDSRENAPVGLVFTSLFLEDGPSTPVALRLDSVEWFRRSIDEIPFGHNAAVLLSGDGLTALRAQLAARPNGRGLFLAAD